MQFALAEATWRWTSIRLRTGCVGIARGAEQSPGSHDTGIEAEGNSEEARAVSCCEEELLAVFPMVLEVCIAHAQGKKAKQEDNDRGYGICHVHQGV